MPRDVVNGWSPHVVEVQPAVRLDRVERPGRRQDVHLGAAHKSARLVGLVELQRMDQLAGRAAPAFQLVVVEAERGAVGVQHQVAADQS